MDAATKTELAWNYGELIISMELCDSYLNLYELDGFFVEICINKETSELEMIRLQEDREILFAYITDLDISDAWSLN